MRKISILKLLLPVLGLLALFSMPAKAADFDWYVTSTVSIVEPTYLPSFVRFQLAQNTGNVCSGKWLDYSGKGVNSETNAMAVFSALLAALASGQRVVIFGTNDCKVHYVHILKD